jgi:glycine cleavage system H protein
MARIERFEFPADRWYHPREHVWVRPEDDGVVRIGLDALGVEALGEVVYVQLAPPAPEIRRGDALGSLEAEKMVRPLLAPVSGALVALNAAVIDAPRLLNRDPYGAGWLLRVRATRWGEEAPDLLHDEAAVSAWARAELEAGR